MAVYCCPILPLASPDLMLRPKPRRDASPLSGRAQPCAPPERPSACPFFSSTVFLLSLPSMPTWPPPSPPRFMLSLASFLAPHSCCTGRMDWIVQAGWIVVRGRGRHCGRGRDRGRRAKPSSSGVREHQLWRNSTLCKYKMEESPQMNQKEINENEGELPHLYLGSHGGNKISNDV